MKQLLILIICFAGIIFPGKAQEEGIRFEKPEWNKIVRKATKEKKLIFVDCYTSWCGPCKDLAKNIFPQKIVGDFYNQYFISTKVDMDKDAMATVLKGKFNPAAFPTLLFLDAVSGEIVHMVVGGGKAERILAVGKEALDAESNLIGLTKRYENGDRQADFMGKYLQVLASAYLKEKYALITTEYLASLSDEQLTVKENWDIFKANIKDPLLPAFKRMMANRKVLYKIVDRQEVDEVFSRIIDAGVRSIIEPSPYAMLREEKVDETRNAALVEYFQNIDFVAVPAALAKLYTAEYARRKDYKAMWNSIQLAYRYNVFRGNEDYAYIWKNIPDLAKGTDDLTVLKDAAKLMEQLDQEVRPYYVRISMMNGRAALLEKAGDQVGAEKARVLARKYREEEEKQNRNE